MIFTVSNKKINYLYNASSVKVEKKVTNGTNIKTTHYTSTRLSTSLDGFQYVNDDLSFFPHAEGYVHINGNPTKTKYWYDYVYNYTDHLGNIRLSYTQDRSTGGLKVLEEHHYYPFGLEHHNYNQAKYDISLVKDIDDTFVIARNAVDYKYKYNGKEWQDELGLNVYDYGNRNYQPDIGRFFNKDRFSEKYYSHTPYHYTVNNPVRFVEMRGDSIDVSAILAYDRFYKTDIISKLTSDLKNITGMSFMTLGNMLVYETNDDGTVKIDKEMDGNNKGSEEAQDILMNAIGDSQIAFVIMGDKSQVTDSDGVGKLGGDYINISPNEIDKFIKGTKGVDNRTMGYGMVFTHEIQHSNVAMGTSRGDPSNGYATGPVVNQMNVIRSQLNEQGMNFGVRSTYLARPTGLGTYTIPFIGGTSNNPKGKGGSKAVSAMGSVTYIK